MATSKSCEYAHFGMLTRAQRLDVPLAIVSTRLYLQVFYGLGLNRGVGRKRFAAVQHAQKTAFTPVKNILAVPLFLSCDLSS